MNDEKHAHKSADTNPQRNGIENCLEKGNLFDGILNLRCAVRIECGVVVDIDCRHVAGGNKGMIFEERDKADSVKGIKSADIT